MADHTYCIQDAQRYQCTTPTQSLNPERPVYALTFDALSLAAQVPSPEAKRISSESPAQCVRRRGACVGPKRCTLWRFQINFSLFSASRMIALILVNPLMLKVYISKEKEDHRMNIESDLAQVFLALLT